MTTRDATHVIWIVNAVWHVYERQLTSTYPR
jgi:hypothetical protein